MPICTVEDHQAGLLFPVGAPIPVPPPVELPSEPPKPEIPDPTEPFEFSPPVAGAVISECQLFRYSLFRTFRSRGKKMLAIGVNPSTADAIQDDNTLMRWQHYARREDCAELWVGNISPYRSTDPKKLKLVDDHSPLANQMILREMADTADIILACWGNNVVLVPGWEITVEWLTKTYADKLYCLGYTKMDQPRHPLRQRNDAPLVRYQYKTVVNNGANPDDDDF